MNFEIFADAINTIYIYIFTFLFYFITLTFLVKNLHSTKIHNVSDFSSFFFTFFLKPSFGFVRLRCVSLLVAVSRAARRGMPSAPFFL